MTTKEKNTKLKKAVKSLKKGQRNLEWVFPLCLSKDAELSSVIKGKDI